MKKLTVIGMITILAVFLGMGLLNAQQNQPAQTPQQGGWYCPWMSGQGYAPQGQGWMCPYCGRGMGHGMMHGGRGMRYGRMHGCPWMGPFYRGDQTQQPQPLTKEEAGQVLDNYLKNTHNPNLKLGDITEKDTYFEGSIVTKEGSLVDRIQVDKNTGWIRSIY